MSTTKTIYEAIIEFQAKMPKIIKTEANPFYKSKYADLANIQSQIQKPLYEAGLGYIQRTVESGLETVLFTKTGEKIDFIYPVNLQGKAQEVGSAITYAKRYSLVALLGLIVDGDDDDGNEAQKQPAKEWNATNTVWLEDKQYQVLLELIEKKENIDGVKATYKKYNNTIIDGVKYAMKKEYRDKLNSLLSDI